ncbi:gastrula zinc finger protein XlCGF26.1-like [Hyperolius riggenbachi]|uniref:gastrula zinc finger protein XlCGF26.1-like n=1 Tax=Hyperolius riggenbachi TaxID=752182 RepID=UPI0035A2DDF1
MTTSLRMEDWSHMTERILDFTLEIIQLVTGENYKLVKEASGEPLTPSSHHHGPSPITKRPPHSLISERNNVKKIVDVINKMMELLTGEEWQYLKEHKDSYKDTMIEIQLPLTSPDGSSNRNPPERCTGPLYSQAENLIDIKHEVKEEEEETEVTGGGQCMEEGDMMVTSELGMPVSDGSSNTNPPEGCTGLLYSQDCAQEEHSYELQYQAEELTDVKVVVKEEEEETEVTGGRQCMEEGDMMVTSELGMPVSDRNVVRNPSNGATEDDGDTQCSLNTGNTHRKDHSANGSPSDAEESPDQSHSIKAPSNAKDSSSNKGPFSCSNCEKYFVAKGNVVQQSEHPFSCSECGKKYLPNSNPVRHLGVHTGEGPYTCSECGKCFTKGAYFTKHMKRHTGETPFSCSECGKGFFEKESLLRHLKTHTIERPYSCSECGKAFLKKSHLDTHQTCHTGERPFSCSECGKRFSTKQCLHRHFRGHTGEKPYSCSECGKCFSDSGAHIKHMRRHTGEHHFSCSECGKGFFEKNSFHRHLKTHTGERPYSCSECGKCFTENGNLQKHIRRHRGERPYSCSECGRSFSESGILGRHMKTHTDKNSPTIKLETVDVDDC